MSKGEQGVVLCVGCSWLFNRVLELTCFKATSGNEVPGSYHSQPSEHSTPEGRLKAEPLSLQTSPYLPLPVML